jgi:hypothetical protein
MRHALDLWSWEGQVKRRQYGVAGLVLFIIKYGLDLMVSHRFRQPWSPLMYVSPRVSPFGVWATQPEYVAFLLAVALPFIAAGVSLSVRRLRDMGVHPFWAGLFFLPYLHFAFFAVLLAVPSRGAPAPPSAPDAGPYRPGPPSPPLPQAVIRLIPRDPASAFLLALGLSQSIGLVAYVVTVQVSAPLGGALFLGVPFGMGFAMGYIPAYHGTIRPEHALFGSVVAIIVGLLLLFGAGTEGMGCLVMVSPLIALVAALGGLAGWRMARGPYAVPGMAVMVALPLAFVWNAKHPPAAELAVQSSVLVDAAPDVVWRSVVAFPPIDTPPAPIFALVAMPIEARIEGTGVGAVRRCIFTNGQFVEPIQVYQPGHELAFGVSAQPAAIDPYIQVSRGQFLLEPRPGGRTLLHGTTWYRLQVGPTGYFGWWTQRFLHAIHMRVLEHVKRVAERGRAVVGAPAREPAWMEQANATCRCTAHVKAD